MATTVTITGTGNPGPSPDRAGPGVLVRHDGLALQFDAGRATTMRLTGLGVRPPELDALFITHHHSDHLTGLADLVLTRWILDTHSRAGPLTIVAPAGPAARFAGQLLDIWREDIDVRTARHDRPRPAIDLQPFDVASVPAEVWSHRDVRVLAGQVRHEPVRPAVGYRVETPDGVVAVTGDTLVCEEVAELAAGADVLVYEALRVEAVLASPFLPDHICEYHADTRLIGAQAAELGVGSLVLTHLIPEPRTPAEIRAFADDVRAAGFTGELLVAADLDTVNLD
ncbi:MAG: MBL fold metallo-hydrolase [Acidimicrobiia bacterium]|nr:MBL fold metallo-hydrolase [Acidimicrobiia bacterium]